MNAVRWPFVPLFLLACSCSVYADSTVHDFVQESLRLLSEKGEISVLHDRIDWPTAYSRMPFADREEFSVHSPQELQERFERIARDPGGEFVEYARKTFPDLSPSEAGEEKAKTEQAIALIRKRVMRTKFTIESIDPLGDQADIIVRGDLDGKSEAVVFKTIRVGPRWYFAQVPELPLAVELPNQAGE